MLLIWALLQEIALASKQTAGSKNYGLFRNVIFSKQQIRVLFTVLCKGDWTDRDPNTNVQNVHFIINFLWHIMKCCFSLLLRLTNCMHCIILCERAALSSFSARSVFQWINISESLFLAAPPHALLYSTMEPEAIQGLLPWHRGMGTHTLCFFHTFTCSLTSYFFFTHFMIQGWIFLFQ